MTDTPKNIAPENYPHTELQMLYVEERREITEAFYTATNTKGEQPIAPRPEELLEGKTPSFNGA